MTYKDFIQGVRDQADYLEQLVKDSQVIDLNDEMGEDDTILFAYQDDVEELLDNATGEHGHVIELKCEHVYVRTTNKAGR